MRLIDADDLRQVLEVYSEKDSLGHTPVQLCDAMPTIDAVEVKHGEWVGFPDSFKYEHVYDPDAIVCPFCEESWNIIDNDTERFNYCPNCGARMDGERRDNGQIQQSN